MNFNDKVVLITGAGSGIGAATALHFANLGASLSLVEIKENLLKTIVKKCEAVGHRKPLGILSDVTKDAQCIIDDTISHYGQLDVLINNAGKVAYGNIESVTLDQYDDIMNLNVRSVFHLTAISVPHLVNTKGTIVNVSSLAGIRASSEILPYSMSKATIDQFTRCVALELAAKGVRVNCVNPGATITSIYLNAGVSPEDYAEMIRGTQKSYPLGRSAKANEIAAGIAFLASNTSSFITGTSLSIDGGRALC